MKRYDVTLALAAVVMLEVFMAPAKAAPPTVTPSPGYDARLQEQRAASQGAGPTVYTPVAPAPNPVARRRVKRVHGGAH